MSRLETRSGQEVVMRLHDLAKEDGRTAVVVTHNPLLQDVADRVLWIEDRRLRDRKGEATLLGT